MLLALKDSQSTCHGKRSGESSVNACSEFPSVSIYHPLLLLEEPASSHLKAQSARRETLCLSKCPLVLTSVPRIHNWDASSWRASQLLLLVGSPVIRPRISADSFSSFTLLDAIADVGEDSFHGLWFLNCQAKMKRGRSTLLKLPTFIESGSFGYGLSQAYWALPATFSQSARKGSLPPLPNVSAQKVAYPIALWYLSRL